MNTTEILGRIVSAGTRALDHLQAIILRALRENRIPDAERDALLSALAERRAALKNAGPIDMLRGGRSSYRSCAKGRRQDRPKLFGDGPRRPMDRNAKARLMVFARTLKAKRPGDAGRHYGELTAKTVDVLEALLFEFHNARTGQCNPSYQRIAEKARCARSTAQAAMLALEQAGLLTWVNRIERRSAYAAASHSGGGRIVRVFRTSNAYRFADPLSRAVCHGSSTDFRSGTTNQDSFLGARGATDARWPPIRSGCRAVAGP
jgi:hypothetical protein